jgi:hypothetical protein
MLSWKSFSMRLPLAITTPRMRRTRFNRRRNQEITGTGIWWYLVLNKPIYLP